MSSMPPPHNTQAPDLYGPPSYGPFPPQRPMNKRRKWPWVLGWISVCVVVLFGGCGLLITHATHEVAKVAGSGIEPGSGTKASAAPAGTQVRDGKFGFTVTQVDPPTKTVGTNEFMKQNAQGEYILVHVDITNTADRPQIYSGDNQKLIDSQGRVYSDDGAAELNIDPNVTTTINPGNRVSVVLAYDVPAGTAPAAIEFHDSMLSGGATVALR